METKHNRASASWLSCPGAPGVVCVYVHVEIGLSALVWEANDHARFVEEVAAQPLQLFPVRFGRLRHVAAQLLYGEAYV